MSTPEKMPPIKIGYKNNVIANSCDYLNFPESQISILLGNNGAGKTTLLKTICGILPPIESSVPKYHSSYLPETLEFPNELRIKDILFCYFGKSQNAFESCIHLDLPLNKMFFELSKGNRQKLRLIVTEFLSAKEKKQILCLDEPLSGLDIKTRKIITDAWAGSGLFPKTNCHRIISIHSGIAPDSYQTILVANGKISQFPPIKLIDEWPNFIKEQVT